MNQLATIETKSLPVNYDHAKQAIATCEEIDECSEWANKSAALAAYAAMSQDREMEHNALRIQARALRRAGQLAKQLAKFILHSF